MSSEQPGFNVAALCAALEKAGLNPATLDPKFVHEQLKSLGISKVGQRQAMITAMQQYARSGKGGLNGGVEDHLQNAIHKDQQKKLADACATAPLEDLTEAQCVDLLKELIEAYQQPTFVTKLEAFIRQHGAYYVANPGFGALVLQAQVGTSYF